MKEIMYMKNKFYSFLIIIVMILLFSCISQTVEDESNSQPVTVCSSTEPDDPLKTSKKTGAPEAIPIDSEKAVQTYEYLKKELIATHPGIELERINKAFSQVVQGYMIILVCTYHKDEDTEKLFLYAKVYYDLEENRSIEELIFDYIPED